MDSTWLFRLLVTVCFLVAGCSRADVPATGASEPQLADGKPSTRAQRQAETREADSERKLIRSGELRLEVDAYQPARRAIDAMATELGGFVAHTEANHDDRTTSTAQLELRVPSHKLDTALRRTRKLGTVLSERLSTEDVTEQHYDLSARLGNARKLEQRLLELGTGQTKSVKDLLEVERELGRVREEIEVLQGKLERLNDRVSLSRLRIHLRTRDTYAAGAPAPFADQLNRAFSGSLTAMVDLGRGALLLGTAIAPWLPLLALVAYLGLVLVRLSTRRVSG